jgi:hypothetical protein
MCEHFFWIVDGGSVSLPGVIAKNGLPTSIDFDRQTYFMADDVLDKCILVAIKPRALHNYPRVMLHIIPLSS